VDLAQRAGFVQIRPLRQRSRHPDAVAVDVCVYRIVSCVRSVPVQRVRRPVQHRRTEAAQSKQDQRGTGEQGRAKAQREKIEE
jgi:hypothetical protein